MCVGVVGRGPLVRGFVGSVAVGAGSGAVIGTPDTGGFGGDGLLRAWLVLVAVRVSRGCAGVGAFDWESDKEVQATAAPATTRIPTATAANAIPDDLRSRAAAGAVASAPTTGSSCVGSPESTIGVGCVGSSSTG